jgi:iduronate 2-sulfatase
VRSLFLLACLAVLLGAAPKAAPMKVYILAGQSNMDGRGKKSDLVGDLARWAKPQPDVLIAYSNSDRRGPFTTGGFVPLEPGFSVPPGTKEMKLPGATFGPEVSFGRAIADANPDARVVLIKFSEGGTSLHGDWMPDAKNSLYPQFLTFVHKSLKSLGDDAKIEAMIWHQGESDASLKESEYQKLLTAFIAQVRKDLSSPDLPFVIGEVYDNGKRDRVRAGERATAAMVPNVFFAPADNLKTSDGGTHFDTASQIEMGQRLAAVLMKKENGK